MNYYRVEASALTLQQSTAVQKVTSLLSAHNLNSSASSTKSTSNQEVQTTLSNGDIQNIYKIIKNFENLQYNPPLLEILQAARLSSDGYITSVEYLVLKEINLDQIPSQHLVSLVSCVAETVYIRNVDGDLATVIKSAKSRILNFRDTALDARQSNLVVKALMDRIEILAIGSNALLDFDILQHYEGLGKCQEINVWCTPSVPHRYKSMLESYFSKLGWDAYEKKKLFGGDYWYYVSNYK